MIDRIMEALEAACDKEGFGLSQQAQADIRHIIRAEWAAAAVQPD